MVALLASYFFPNAVHLTDIEWRKPGTAEYRIQQSWTQPSAVGEKYFDKEVYILTSSHTPSAAEAFTYDLKALKRATVVGETTWGGANPGGVEKLDEHFMAFIPAGRAINSITKTNWEGKGVEPDITATADKALKIAYTTALKHLADKSTDPQEQQMLRHALADAQADLQAEP